MVDWVPLCLHGEWWRVREGGGAGAGWSLRRQGGFVSLGSAVRCIGIFFLLQSLWKRLVVFLEANHAISENMPCSVPFVFRVCLAKNLLCPSYSFLMSGDLCSPLIPPLQPWASHFPNFLICYLPVRWRGRFFTCLRGFSWECPELLADSHPQTILLNDLYAHSVLWLNIVDSTNIYQASILVLELHRRV